MYGFKERFDAYGADYTATMERFMGNETMYLRFLDMLFEDKSLQKLGDALKAGDLTEAFAAAHTLKGVAGNMGLAPLYQTICEIVEPLRIQEAQRDYPALYQAIRTEFQRVDLLRKQIKDGEGS